MVNSSSLCLPFFFYKFCTEPGLWFMKSKQLLCQSQWVTIIVSLFFVSKVQFPCDGYSSLTESGCFLDGNLSFSSFQAAVWEANVTKPNYAAACGVPGRVFLVKQALQNQWSGETKCQPVFSQCYCRLEQRFIVAELCTLSCNSLLTPLKPD